MNKMEKIVKDIVKKSTDTKEQVGAHAERISKEYLARGFGQDDVDRLVPQALQAYYKKQLKSTANAFEGIILGRTNTWDMAKKPRNIVREKIEELGLKGAMDAGFVNSEGEYLYNDYDWRKGKSIPENDYQCSVFMVADTGENDEFEIAIMRLRGDNCEIVPPLFEPVSFRAVKGKMDNNGRRQLYDIKVTEFEPVGADSFDALDFFENQLSKLIDVVQLSDLEQWHDANVDNFNRFCISKVNCVRINMTDETVASNVMEVDDISLELDMEQSNTITVWVPKRVDVNFPENTMEMLLVSQTSQNNEGNISLNCLGLWVHPAFRVDVDHVIDSDNDVGPQNVPDLPVETEEEMKGKW